MGSFRRRLGQFVEAFVPADAETGSPDELRRARLAVVLAMLMVLVFIALAFAHWTAESPLEAVLNGVLSVLMALGLVAFRITGRFRPVFHGVLAIAFSFIVSLCVLTRGGGANPATVALAEVPLFATIIGGIKVGVVWLCMSMVASIAIGILAAQGLIWDRMPEANQLFDDHVSLLVISGTLFIVATLYEVWTRQSLEHIEALDRKRRRAELDKIEAMSEVRIAQAERLASMGRIAASTAHEINNPLTVVMAGLEHARDMLPPGDPNKETMESILDSAIEGAERIRRIVREMRSFARVDEADSGPVDVAAAVAAATKMTTGSVRPRAHLTVELDSLPPVLAHESQLVQVLLNLILNAAEAMPEGQASQRHIEIRGRTEGPRVHIEVIDNGPGIPRDDMRRVFEPFFTTKPVGEGMGLGLALCHSIVRRHHGTLELESRPGRTVARLSLVAAQAKQIGAKPKPLPPNRPSDISELDILVVDDEATVASSLQLLLEPHHTAIATDGEQALEILANRTFDLILCDVMMPKVSGIDIYERLLETSPQVARNIVFMSGGTFTQRAAEFRTKIKNPFLDKPILRRDLQPILQARARRKLASAS